jgi:hypothetical protein
MIAQAHNALDIRCGNTTAEKLLNEGKTDSVITFLLPQAFNGIPDEFRDNIWPVLKTALYRKYTFEQLKNEVTNAKNTIVLQKLNGGNIPSEFRITIFHRVIDYKVSVTKSEYYYHKYGQDKYYLKVFNQNTSDSIKNKNLTASEMLFCIKKRYEISSLYKELSSLK